MASSSDDKEATNVAPLWRGTTSITHTRTHLNKEVLALEGMLQQQIKSHNGTVICFETFTVP